MGSNTHVIPGVRGALHSIHLIVFLGRYAVTRVRFFRFIFFVTAPIEDTSASYKAFHYDQVEREMGLGLHLTGDWMVVHRGR
jgi:hypothetical protein